MLKISDLASLNQKFYYYTYVSLWTTTKGTLSSVLSAGIEIVGEKNYLKDVEAIYLGAHYIIRIRITIYFENKLNWWWSF
ncbi:hypothetical protein [Mycoplasmopsis cynos]|uniref:hypothetical protein n=1 Tax=Mycoplasmopsis cynos TaxID=171284 RepID=UPI00220A9080|nr:hypothetical protein [Mycoplasmopsis cynos]UWV77113.1 hypothetical protein NW070_05070 [Mycoplasmopsis cynos]